MNLHNKPKSPFLLFIGCFGIGIFVLSIFAFLLVATQGGMRPGSLKIDLIHKPMLVILQVAQMISLFIIPAILFALFSKNDFLVAFNLKKPFLIKRYGIAVLLAIFSFPFLIYLENLIEKIPLPENIKQIAVMENEAINQALSLFLDSPDPINFIVMLLIIGLGAGLTEELFFRGLFMPLLIDWTKNKWAGILISALLFSVSHMSIYNFIPIMVIAVLFGYLYTQTHDLKLNIFIHSIFNGIQVVLNYLFQIKLISTEIKEIETFPAYIAIPCLIISFFLFRYLSKSDEQVSY